MNLPPALFSNLQAKESAFAFLSLHYLFICLRQNRPLNSSPFHHPIFLTFVQKICYQVPTLHFSIPFCSDDVNFLSSATPRLPPCMTLHLVGGRTHFPISVFLSVCMSAALRSETPALTSHPDGFSFHSPGFYFGFVSPSNHLRFYPSLLQPFSLIYPLMFPPLPMISSPGLRVPEPLTQLIPTDSREVRQPFETLDQVPHLSTIRFELDISLLVYQPLNYIAVTLSQLTISRT